ncbi:unnamed protein product, partial [Prunus brigantina]
KISLSSLVIPSRRVTLSSHPSHLQTPSLLSRDTPSHPKPSLCVPTITVTLSSLSPSASVFFIDFFSVLHPSLPSPSLSSICITISKIRTNKTKISEGKHAHTQFKQHTQTESISKLLRITESRV